MYRSLLTFLAMVAIASSVKVRKCRCGNEDFEFPVPTIYQSDAVRSLEQLQFNFPAGDYGNQFGDNIRTFVGSIELILQELRDQHIDQTYITTLEGYLRDIMGQIQQFGSLQDPQRYHEVITEFVNYLMTRITDLSDYTKTIQDKDVQNYFYSVMLQWLSARSFLVSSLRASRCIYHTTNHQGDGHERQDRPYGSTWRNDGHEREDPPYWSTLRN